MVKSTFLDDGDIQKVTKELIGILNVLFLGSFLYIVLVFQEIEAGNLI